MLVPPNISEAPPPPIDGDEDDMAKGGPGPGTCVEGGGGSGSRSSAWRRSISSWFDRHASDAGAPRPLLVVADGVADDPILLLP
mmetsp:Transcript_20671/g.28095  ORF Transcript_20671/g.28095 Transcript_20671/m.28095 type:complete len:84 (-) Transcript_20671:91-342(-)